MIADKYGRKRMIKWYAFLYILSCFTKHFNDFNILALGRVLGGIATSILMTVFDTWLISEHSRLNLDKKLLEETFELQVAVNSAVAVISGIVAGMFLFEGDNIDLFYYGGYTIPFDMASIVLMFGIYLLNRYWLENYGTRGSGRSKLNITKEILLLGLVQSLFEASMYCFIFSWTPALGNDYNYGFVFGLLMLSVAFGSKIKMNLIEILSLGSISLILGPLAKIYGYNNSLIYLLSFLLFELSVGAYFPVMGIIKSKVVPEEHRATVYNLFRIPMNLIVVLVLTQSLRIDDILILSSQMLFVATILYKLM
jgi:hypothetical protein